MEGDDPIGYSGVAARHGTASPRLTLHRYPFAIATYGEPQHPPGSLP